MPVASPHLQLETRTAISLHDLYLRQERLVANPKTSATVIHRQRQKRSTNPKTAPFYAAQTGGRCTSPTFSSEKQKGREKFPGPGPRLGGQNDFVNVCFRLEIRKRKTQSRFNRHNGAPRVAANRVSPLRCKPAPSACKTFRHHPPGPMLSTRKACQDQPKHALFLHTKIVPTNPR